MDKDEYARLSDSAISRGWKDAWAAASSNSGVIVQLLLSVGTAAVSALRGFDPGREALVAVGTFFGVFALLVLWKIGRSPYRQRDEARQGALEALIADEDRFLASRSRESGRNLVDRLHPLSENVRLKKGLSDKETEQVLLMRTEIAIWLHNTHQSLRNRNERWGRHFEDPPQEVPGDPSKMMDLITSRMIRINDVIPPDRNPARLG
jgi:hypothetical protein